MAHYEGDRLDLELEGIEELDVRIVAGEVTVTGVASGWRSRCCGGRRSRSTCTRAV
jgi:hypothetical protein